MVQKNTYTKRDLLVKEAKSHLNTPYEFNASGQASFDSSNFVKYVYKKALNITIPKTVYDQMKIGVPISRADLLPGDLVFAFKGTHVSIYIGRNQIIHCPYIGKKVEISNMSDFYSARRLI